MDASIVGRAQEAGKIAVRYYNPRDFTIDKHRITDLKPYGGGPGMVMKAEPIVKAVDKARGKKKKVKVIIFSPSGRQFDNAYARKLARSYTDIIMIAGRYEGVDERVATITKAEKISVGPYVLTGGELPAMIVADAVSRQVPNVLGRAESLEEDRVASPEVYTRPPEFTYKKKKYKVPPVLLAGDHKKIEAWRKGKLVTGDESPDSV